VPAQRVHELITTHAAAVPQWPAVIADDAVVTFGELDRHSATLAGWLDAHTTPGDRVAVVADNSAAYAVLYYAVARSGRILTLVNQRLSAAEQSVQIATSEAGVVFGDRIHLAALAPARPVVIGGPEWDSMLDHPAYTGPEPAPDDPAWLVFSTGSTGTPKGALHTHRSLTAGVWGTVEGRSVPPADVYLFPFPMCHIAGYNVLVRHATGSTVVLTERFRPAEFVETVNAHRVAACSLAPTMLHALLDHVEQTGATMPSLREVAYGSSAISADLIERATAVLRVDFHQGYGMTETAGNVTFLGPDDHRAGGDLLRSAGQPHSGVEVAIVDPGADGAGEVVVRGPQVMARYWQDPAATAAALTDGWLRTGDIGRLDASGRLWIVDRAKDVIITGGENVSSREVEDALSTHPDVDTVAVVGVPDAYWGEAICAVVVARAGATPSPPELIGYVRDRISAFKRPRHVVFVDALPVTSNGKVAKGRVRELARDATLGRWPRSRH
jgi:acyl-CoA synthetase (AMP-forming)/AMP-acid ligase II